MKPYYTDSTVTLYHGANLDVLPHLADGSVDCVVTSPPYFGLRSYLPEGHPDKADEYGAEETPAEFVANLVATFREVRRVLAVDGVVWINLGDSYASGGTTRSLGRNDAGRDLGGGGNRLGSGNPGRQGTRAVSGEPSAKNLLGIPWRTAFALQDDGWILRNAVVWCLSGGAWIYARTAKGDMPVMLKDLVRLDPATVQLWNGEKWTRVLGWGPSTDITERLELVLRSGERVGCTGQHEWPTQRGVVAARDLRVGDTLATCNTPQPDGCTTPGYLTPDVLWLIGLYLAEGSRSGDTLQLALNSDEIDWLPRIRTAAAHLGGTVAHTVMGGSLHVRMHGRVVNAAIAAYVGGATAIDKHIRNAAWSLPNASLQVVLQGYLDGDGHHDVKNERWRLGFCRNYALERDLRTAAARLGATITLHPRLTAAFGRIHKTFRGEWRWTRTGHHSERDRGEVIEIRASRARRFWDIAVEDDPHLFALASGVLTHNCKPNAMPESVTDRLSTRYEMLFLLSKSRRYWFDLDPIRSDYSERVQERQKYAGRDIPASGYSAGAGRNDVDSAKGILGFGHKGANELGRNPGDVWTIPTVPYAGAHFATYPPELVRRCIVSGCKPGGTVLDPFHGSGTTGMVATRNGRKYVGIELNREYLDLSLRTRLADGVLDFEEPA